MGRSDNVGLPFWRLYIVRFIAKMMESGPVLHQNSHFLISRFAQDCTSFPNVQYMCKFCARLYCSPQCTIYVQDLHKICARLYFSPNAPSPLTIYAQNIIIQQVITFSIFLFKSTGQTTFNKKIQIRCDFF